MERNLSKEEIEEMEEVIEDLNSKLKKYSKDRIEDVTISRDNVELERKELSLSKNYNAQNEAALDLINACNKLIAFEEEELIRINKATESDEYYHDRYLERSRLIRDISNKEKFWRDITSIVNFSSGFPYFYLEDPGTSILSEKAIDEFSDVIFQEYLAKNGQVTRHFLNNLFSFKCTRSCANEVIMVAAEKVTEYQEKACNRPRINKGNSAKYKALAGKAAIVSLGALVISLVAKNTKIKEINNN